MKILRGSTVSRDSYNSIWRVILSVAGRFACESPGGVEGPRVFATPHWSLPVFFFRHCFERVILSGFSREGSRVHLWDCRFY